MAARIPLVRMLLIPVLPSAVVTSAVLVSTVGCGGPELRVINPDVSRKPYVFESDAAETRFEEEVERRYDDGEAVVEADLSQYSQNAFYNQQLDEADTNIDGIISEAESARYQERGP
jgi:hypothetical protein